MRDRRWRRPLAALALAAGAALVAPMALAAESDWNESAYDPATTAVQTTPNFVISGTLVRTRAQNELVTRKIVDANMTFAFVDGTGDGFDPSCIPDETVNAALTREEATSGGVSKMTFSLPAEAFEWRCNGRFRITVTGTTAPADSYELVGSIAVAVAPKPVEDLHADAGDETGAVELRWEPLASEDVRDDAQGYRIQRAVGDGEFSTVGSVEDSSLGSFQDEVDEPGSYRYRVQSLRRGPDGPVPSADAPIAEVTVDGPPTTSTPGVTNPPTTNGVEIPDIGAGGRRRARPGSNRPAVPTLNVPSPPTTLDTGFNDTLDYGDRDVPEPGEELADGGEGQSVINTPAEGAGLLGPVAGAMVLLGWAGHVAYLNRLAKQF